MILSRVMDILARTRQYYSSERLVCPGESISPPKQNRDDIRAITEASLPAINHI